VELGSLLAKAGLNGLVDFYLYSGSANKYFRFVAYDPRQQDNLICWLQIGGRSHKIIDRCESRFSLNVVIDNPKVKARAEFQNAQRLDDRFERPLVIVPAASFSPATRK